MSAGQDTDETNAAAGNDPLSIGARLAAARKACELDQRVVANELHLDLGTIEALENDDKATMRDWWACRKRKSSATMQNKPMSRHR
jgi:DNA-binding XRE family transcriptional regulator